MQKRIKSRFVWQWLGSFQTISQCSYLTVKNVQKKRNPKKGHLLCITFIGGNNFSIRILISYLRSPYARHCNWLLIRNRSWILTIPKARILRKKLLEKTFLDFKKWVKSIQTGGYNGARTAIGWFSLWLSFDSTSCNQII